MLNETQQLLWRLITAPEGVAAALAGDDDRGGDLRAALTRSVRADGRLDAVQRVDIYANMYFFRLLDVLKNDYPATLALLGEVGFHNLITDYLLAHPPAHFSVREAGRHVPEFLTSHGAADAHPCAADLARYERALNDAFDAADAPALATTALAAIPAETWPELRFALHPSVRLIDCAWPVDALRAAADRGEAVADLPAAATRLCVWRHERAVFHRHVAALEFAALTELERGAPFAQVCATASEMNAADASREVADALAGWIERGWLRGDS